MHFTIHWPALYFLFYFYWNAAKVGIQGRLLSSITLSRYRFVKCMCVCLFFLARSGEILLPVTFLGTPYWNWVRPPFYLQNRLLSLWQKFDKVLKTLLWDFGPYWRDGVTLLAEHPWRQSPVLPHLKGALLDCDQVTVEDNGVKRTHCQV